MKSHNIVRKSDWTGNFCYKKSQTYGINYKRKPGELEQSN